MNTSVFVVVMLVALSMTGTGGYMVYNSVKAVTSAELYETVLYVSYNSTVNAGVFRVGVTLDIIPTSSLTVDQVNYLNQHKSELIGNKLIKIYHSVTVVASGTTDNSGVVSLSISEGTDGTYTYVVKFEGNTFMKPYEKSIIVTVISNPPPGPKNYTLVVTHSSGGHTDFDGTLSLVENTPVVISAFPDSGYSFRNWTYTEGLGTFTVYTSPLYLTMIHDYNIYVAFSLTEGMKYKLTITSGTGGTTTPSGVVEYEENTYASVLANSSSGYLFDHWSGSTIVSDNPVSILMDSDKTLTPIFKLIPVQQYSLSIAEPIGIGTTSPVTGIYTYDTGTVVTLTATPGSSYDFSGWLFQGSFYVVLTNPYQLIMNRSWTLRATFVAKPTYSMSLSTSQVSVYPVNTTSISCTVEGLNGYTGTLNVVVQSNVDVTLTPEVNSVTLSSTSTKVTFNIQVVTGDIATGSYVRMISVGSQSLSFTVRVLDLPKTNIVLGGPFSKTIGSSFGMWIGLNNTYKITMYNFTVSWDETILRFDKINWVNIWTSQTTIFVLSPSNNSVTMEASGLTEFTNAGVNVLSVGFVTLKTGHSSIDVSGYIRYRATRTIGLSPVSTFCDVNVQTGSLFLTAVSQKIYDFDGDGWVCDDDVGVIETWQNHNTVSNGGDAPDIYDVVPDGKIDLKDYYAVSNQYGTTITSQLYIWDSDAWVPKRSIVGFGHATWHSQGSDWALGTYRLRLVLSPSNEYFEFDQEIVLGSNYNNITIMNLPSMSIGIVTFTGDTNLMIGTGLLGSGIVLIIAIVYKKKKEVK